jgi:hypothetical protein
VKITHRGPAANWFQVPESDAVDPAYEAEVQRSTQRSEREYRQRQERLARAEAKLAAARTEARAKKNRVSKKYLAELEALVSLRREELEEYQRMMLSVPASAAHRGVKSFRPVPDRNGTSGL